MGMARQRRQNVPLCVFRLLPLFFPARSSNIQRVGSSLLYAFTFSPSLVSPSPSLPTTTTSCLIPPPVQQLTCMKVCMYAGKRTCQQLLTAHEGGAKEKMPSSPVHPFPAAISFVGRGKCLSRGVDVAFMGRGGKEAPFSLENPGLSYRAWGHCYADGRRSVGPPPSLSLPGWNPAGMALA